MASNSNQQSNIASLKKSRLGESTQSNLIAGLSTKNTLSPNPSPLKSINSHNGLVGNTNNVTRNIDVLTEETIDSPSQFVMKRQDRGSRNITNLQLTPALAGSNNKIRLTEPNSPSALSRQLVNHIVQTSALSTLAANMNISKEDKLQYALSREDRELAKLQRIFEVERSKAEERQRKYQNSIDKTERGQDLHKQFISQRESNLKQKNDQAMARAKQNDQRLKEKRASMLVEREEKQASMERRRQEDNEKFEKLRQDEITQRRNSYEARILSYQEDFNNKISSLERQLQDKHISSEQYKEQSAQANEMRQRQQSQAKQDQIQLNLIRFNTKNQQDKDQYQSVLDRKSHQTEQYKANFREYHSALKKEGEDRHMQIQAKINKANSQLENKIMRTDSTLERKKNQVQRFEEFKEHERKLKEQYSKKRQDNRETTMFRAEQNLSNFQSKADNNLNRKKNSSDMQHQRNKEDLDIKYANINAQREAKEERMNRHNINLANIRQQKLDKYDSKIAGITDKVNSDKQAQAEIRRFKEENANKKRQLQQAIQQMQAINR